MELLAATPILDCLSHPGRLAVFRLLTRRLPDAVRPSEMAEALELKANTLSVYLSALEAVGLVTSERQGRAIFYRAEMGQMADLIDFLIADCCRGRPELCADSTDCCGPGARPVVLFLCTGNSARSIFAEALLRHKSAGAFDVHSAGAAPKTALNPVAVQVLQDNGVPVEGLYPKDTRQILAAGDTQLDAVITLCDNAANQDTPPWQGAPATAHWGLPDPAVAGDDSDHQYAAFEHVFRLMERRIDALLALPLDQMDKSRFQTQLDAIGQLKFPQQ